jgi:hypothetical protein
LKVRKGRKMKSLFPILYKAFTEKDMSLLEVNPLIVILGTAPACARRQGVVRRQRAVPPRRHLETCVT